MCMEHREWAGEQLLREQRCGEVALLWLKQQGPLGVEEVCSGSGRFQIFLIWQNWLWNIKRARQGKTPETPMLSTWGGDTSEAVCAGGGSHKISKLSGLVEGRAGGVCNRHWAPQDLYAVWPVWTHRGVEGCTHWRLMFPRPLTCLKHFSPARPGLVYREVKLCPRQF